MYQLSEINGFREFFSSLTLEKMILKRSIEQTKISRILKNRKNKDKPVISKLILKYSMNVLNEKLQLT